MANQQQPQKKTPAPQPVTPPIPEVLPAAGEEKRFFMVEDWVAAAMTFLISGAVFLYYMSPSITLQDSGELVTGAYNFGVPHPPGYPLWAFLGWVWRCIVQIGNPAWRICLMSVTTGAAVTGLMTLLMTRSILTVLRASPWKDDVEEKLQHWIALTVGSCVSLLFAFNRGVWLWSCVPEMRVMSVFMFFISAIFFFAWLVRPQRYGFLYATMLLYALGIANHQTVIMMALPFMVGAVAVGFQEPADSFVDRMKKLHGFWELLVAGLFAAMAGFFVMSWLRTSDLGYFSDLGVQWEKWTQQVQQWQQQVGFAQRLGEKFPPKPPMPEAVKYFLLAIGSHVLGVVTIVVLGLLRWLNWWRALILAGLFILGASFYCYMPIASATNPPMNWGYAATKQGFLHAVSRGQYEKVRIANVLGADFLIQIKLQAQALMNQFSWPVAIVGVLPLVMLVVWWKKFGRRGRSWLLFVLVAFVWTLIGLLAVINPGLEKQQQEINIKFFAPAHGFWAMLIGYGMALTLAWALAQKPRRCLTELLRLIAGVFVAVVGAGLLWVMNWLPALLVAWLKCSAAHNWDAFVGGVLTFFLGITGCVCFLAGMALFTQGCVAAWRPCVRVLSVLLLLLAIIPFKVNWAICEQRGHDFGYQFGYRMFCPGGGYPPMDKDAVLFGGTDPGRFVPTYMIFCESFAKEGTKFADPNFDPVGGAKFDRRDVYIITQNALADGTYMSYIRDHYDFSRPDPNNPSTLTDKPAWQRAVFRWGWNALDRKNTFPKEPIYIPTENDLQLAFKQYVNDVQLRRARGEPPSPDEDVEIINGQVQVRGVGGVMRINGILTKWIHERNKDKHTFYVEESYVIQWMYPYMEPFGVILKINKEPLPSREQDPELWKKIVERDTVYWDKIEDDFKARPEFKRDTDAQKTFSKLRSAVGGLYLSRKMYDEAVTAFQQAQRLCPDSPEANFRLAQLYMELNRQDDAIKTLEEYQLRDPLNAKIGEAVKQLRLMKEATERVRELEKALTQSPRDVRKFIELAETYGQVGRFDRIVVLCDNYLAQTNLPAGDILQTAQLYLRARQPDRCLLALQMGCKQHPAESTMWYAYGLVAAALRGPEEAIPALEKAIQLNPALRDTARNDTRLGPLQNNSRFRKLIGVAPAAPQSLLPMPEAPVPGPQQ